MKVLMTNDDGPPGVSSPYILPLYNHIKDTTDWEPIVVIPDSQKSWISKAIFIEDKVEETYYNPKTERVSREKEQEGNWTLLSGTPTTCAAIGIHHICDSKPDLLLSGPNFGRNTSSIAALASGTIGAALEGAGAGVRGIAVSYAFWSKETNNEAWVAAATQMTVSLTRYLYNNWEEGVDLYTVNIPLCDELAQGNCKIFKTRIHQAQHSCLFQQTRAPPLTESKLRMELSQGKDTTVPSDPSNGTNQPPPNPDSTPTPTSPSNQESDVKTYEFRPRFEDLSRTIDTETGRQSDTWAISRKQVSVTPLRANFQHVEACFGQREIKL